MIPRAHLTARTLAISLLLFFAAYRPTGAAAQYYGQTNVALGKPVTALTNIVLGTPSNVTDGNYATPFYSFQGAPSQQIYTIDLGTAHAIGKLFIFVAQARQIEIQSSLDGDTWESRAAFSWGQMVSSPVTLTPDGSYAARYFKYLAWNGATDDAYVGCTEFAVYPWVAETPPPATGSNVALGKPASDYYSPVPSFGAANAVDGNLGTIWKGSYVDGRLTNGVMNIDLGAPIEIGAIRVHQSAAGGSHAFLVALEDDGTSPVGGSDWIAHGDPTLFGTDAVLAGTREFVLPQTATHRFVWVVVYNNLSPSSVLPGMLEIDILSTTAIPTSTPTSTPASTPTPSPVPTRSPAAKSKCDAGKIQCVATKQACLLGLHSKAEKKGVQVDGIALLKCKNKLDGGSKPEKGCIAKLEATQNATKPQTICSVTGDLAVLEAKVDDFATDVVSTIDPSFPAVRPPNSCDAGKKICLRTKANCLLKVRLTAVKKDVPVDAAALQKCQAEFDGGSKPEKGCIAKLEAKQNANKPQTICSVTGDLATLESTVDAFVTDVVSAIRNPP